MLKNISAAALFSLCLLLGDSANAEKNSMGESYATPEFKEVVQTLVLLKGMDINDPKIADEYAQLMYCSLYREKYTSDFDWNGVRQQIISRVESRKEYYRDLYEINGIFYLGRYNFETQDFPFVMDSALRNVGSMLLLEPASFRPYCNRASGGEVFPNSVVFEMSQPLNFDRLKIPMDEAEKLLDRMLKLRGDPRKVAGGLQEEVSRYVYVRFRLKATSSNKIDVSKGKSAKAALKGDIVAIDVFLDKELTRFVLSVPLN